MRKLYMYKYFFRNNLTGKQFVHPTLVTSPRPAKRLQLTITRALEHRINEDPGSGRKYESGGGQGELVREEGGRNKKVIETPVGPSQHYRPPRDSLISVCEL